MSNSLGINLRRYRNLRGLTQEVLADKAGLSRVGYRNIETGKSEPNAKTLDELASVLGVNAFDLIAETPSPQSLRFRAHKRMSAFEKAEREEDIVETMNWLSDFNELEAILKKKPACTVEPTRAKPSDIRRFAEKVRREYFEIACDECVPSIGDVLEQNGVKVRLSESRIKSFFGFSVGAKDGGPAVVVNRMEGIPVERQIFTAAHELGHLFCIRNHTTPRRSPRMTIRKKKPTCLPLIS